MSVSASPSTVSASPSTVSASPSGDVPDRPADLSEGDRRRLLAARLLTARRARPVAVDPLAVPRDRDSHPCSPQQRRFWLARQIDDTDAALGNAAVAFRLRGPLDRSALAGALAAVTARHEVLRTVLAPDPAGAEPSQRILPSMDTQLDVVDLTGLPAAEREPRAQDLTQQAMRERFDLASGPLLRATLLWLAADDHVLLLVCDHITMDEPSTGTLLDDLARHYAARRTGAPDPPPPPLQYVDYAVWAAGRQAAGEQERREAWWRRRLAPPRPELALPFVRPEPVHPDDVGQHATITLPAAVLDRLCRSGRPNATPFAALLTVLKLLLARYAGEPDLTVGTISAGRDLPAWEPVLGRFMDLLAVRTDLAGADTFAAALARVRASVAGALAHELSFDRVVALANPDRSRRVHPLFPVIFTLLSRRTGYGDWPGLTTDYWPHEPYPDQLDLTVEATLAGDGGVWISFRSRPGAVEPGAVTRLAGHFGTLATGLAADPAAPLDRVAVAPARERAELLAYGHGPSVPVPDATVLDQFRCRALAHPDAPAVTDGGDKLSYQELSVRVAALAGQLRAAGAGPGSLVAICLDRCADLVAAPLAVWANGAAWVPVDPEYPPDRQEFVMADAGATVLVTRRALADRLPRTEATLVHVDDPAGTEPAPATVASPDDLAYVLHTSGSTGRPKGVAVTHHNLANFLQVMGRLVEARADHRWLAVTSLAFDIAGLELWLPLVTGGSLVMVPDEATRDGRALAELASGVSHIQTTPSTWQLLLAGGLAPAPGLVGLVGGEAVPLPLARQLRAVTHRLINVYGPTETTIWSTSWEVPEQPTEVSIGTPIDNTQVYVLDPQGEPTPQGVPGELYIGGDGVARGYLGRPALTAQRFVPDPYVPGARLYRTGDRVRWRHDGCLEFLGRLDNQVKVRGHRIEPGEIEARLLEHPDVAQAAVVACPDPVGEVALAGYYVAESRAHPDPAVLRRYLATALPAYLVPPYLCQLPALPLTPNGKLDRAALPAPQRGGAAYTPPRTEVERLVAQVWADVLDTDEVGVGDDFFDLGGHSLLALRMMARLGEVVGQALPVQLCFLHTTVAELAAALEEQAR